MFFSLLAPFASAILTLDVLILLGSVFTYILMIGGARDAGDGAGALGSTKEAALNKLDAVWGIGSGEGTTNSFD